MVLSSETGTWGFPKPVAFKNWLNLLILVSLEPVLVDLEGEPPLMGLMLTVFQIFEKKTCFLGPFCVCKNHFSEFPWLELKNDRSDCLYFDMAKCLRYLDYFKLLFMYLRFIPFSLGCKMCWGSLNHVTPT